MGGVLTHRQRISINMVNKFCMGPCYTMKCLLDVHLIPIHSSVNGAWDAITDITKHVPHYVKLLYFIWRWPQYTSSFSTFTIINY